MANRRFLLGGSLLVLLTAATSSRAQTASLWDATWIGQIGKIDPSPISITIAHNTAVSYSVGGTPFVIRYGKITPTPVWFGDRDHDRVKLARTGDAIASAGIHGRNGYRFAALTKQ